MIGSRHRSREIALQLLYMRDVLPESDVETTLADIEAPADVKAYAARLAAGVMRARATLDARIAAAADNWDLHRLAAVDRNVLRLAVYELLEEDDVPPKVAIDEAIEIAKRFSGGPSGGFVNGILDRILRDLDAPLPAAGSPAEDEPDAEADSEVDADAAIGTEAATDGASAGDDAVAADDDDGADDAEASAATDARSETDAPDAAPDAAPDDAAADDAAPTRADDASDAGTATETETDDRTSRGRVDSPC